MGGGEKKEDASYCHGDRRFGALYQLVTEITVELDGFIHSVL